MRVRELMAKEPATCAPDTSLLEVAGKMVECDCGMIPVLEAGQKPVGTVTDRDIACRAVATGRNPLELRARDVMTTPCVTVSPEADLDECARLLEKHQVRRIVVADENGCCGVVAQSDLARNAAPEKTAEVVRQVSKPTQETARAR